MKLRIVGGECEVPDPSRTPEIGRLAGIARDLGIPDRVVFQGCKPRAELRHWYAAADVFVTTPWYEPFGITPLEAMACARPVVGSAVGGIQYSVRDGHTGLLVPPHDPDALADALATLRSAPAAAAAMGESGWRRVQAMFTWDRVAARLAEIFGQVCRAPRQSLRKLPPVPATAGMRSPAVFIDKDGTLVEDVPFNVDPAKLRFTPHALEALRLWQGAGYRLVIITNQPGLARGLFSQGAVDGIQRELTDQLALAGITLDGFFACPHHEQAACACRKPQPGLLLEAARRLDIDLEASWMVGDILNDVEAGHRAGCRSVLLDVGNETEWLSGPLREPELCCVDLLEAARATLQPGAGLRSAEGSDSRGVAA